MAETITDLVPQTIDAVAVFTGGLDDLLAGIRAKATETAADVTTAAGRKAIASTAYRVAQSKTFIDAAGKSLVEEAKKKTAAIDAERKRARDYLDALKDEVRRPLTEWEAAQAAVDAAIAEVAAAPRAVSGLSSAEIAAHAVKLKTIPASIPAERRDEYARAVETALVTMRAMHADAVQREADAAELAKLRADAEAKAKADREEALRREGEERARQAAERAIADAAARAERQKAEAIEAERRKVAAEKAAAEAEERARREAADRLAKDEAHRGDVNARAVAALVAAGVPWSAAEVAVLAVMDGKVPGMTMVY